MAGVNEEEMIFIVGGCFLAFFLIGYRTGMEDNRLKHFEYKLKCEDYMETIDNIFNK